MMRSARCEPRALKTNNTYQISLAIVRVGLLTVERLLDSESEPRRRPDPARAGPQADSQPRSRAIYVLIPGFWPGQKRN